MRKLVITLVALLLFVGAVDWGLRAYRNHICAEACFCEIAEIRIGTYDWEFYGRIFKATWRVKMTRVSDRWVNSLGHTGKVPNMYFWRITSNTCWGM